MTAEQYRDAVEAHRQYTKPLVDWLVRLETMSFEMRFLVRPDSSMERVGVTPTERGLQYLRENRFLPWP